MRVNPILKKWAHNDENTLDLDNPNEIRNLLSEYEFGVATRNFNEVENPLINTKGIHNRSASGASQYSVATAGSGQRTGSFVHPFQQTPRPFTPSSSTAIAAINSSQDLLRSNDISKRWIDEEVEPQNHNHYNSTSNSSSYHSTPLTQSSPSSHIPQTHFCNRISFSRLALVSSHPSFSSQNISTHELHSSDKSIPRSSSTVSIEKGFRLRSRSEVISRGRAKSVQEARRRFIEKERLQEEKAAREEIKKLEKRQQKEAIRIERSNRQSSGSLSSRPKRSKSDATSYEAGESLSTRSTVIESDDLLFKSEETHGQKHSSFPAKQKTFSACAMFIMWFRMRLMHLGSRVCCKG